MKDKFQLDFDCLQVVLIIEVRGACRCNELVNFKIGDVDNVKSNLLVKISHTKTNKDRSFIIMGEQYLSIYRKYVALRPKDFIETRFLIKPK